MKSMVVSFRELMLQQKKARRIWWTSFVIAICLMPKQSRAELGVVVSAQTRYPWSGIVDLSFAVQGDAGKKYNVSFVAKDLDGGTNVTMSTIYKNDGARTELPVELASGTYSWTWDARTDLGSVNLSRVSIEVTAEKKKDFSADGLVSYWSFDTDCDDESGNGYNFSTAVSRTSGIIGNAAYFDGTFNSGLTKEMSLVGTMSVAFWVKSEKVSDRTKDLTMGYGNYGYNFRTFPKVFSGGFAISVESQRVIVFLGDCCYLQYKVVTSDGWHHLAVTICNSLAPVLYVDGVEVSASSTAFHGTLTLTSPLMGGEYRSGQNPEANQKYQGYVDEMFIYNRVLSSEEVQDLYDGAELSSDEVTIDINPIYPDFGLIAHWGFDCDNSDKSGNGYDLSGNVEWKNGASGSGAYFAGTNVLEMAKSLGITNTMTVACWLRPKKVGTGPQTITMGSGNYGYNFKDFSNIFQGDGMSLSVELHRIILFKNDNCYLVYNVNLGEGWQHVAITVADGGTPSLYHNGVKVSANACAIGSFTLKTPVIGGTTRVNQNPNSDQRYKGYLDELVFYNRVLSDAEISALCGLVK